MLVSYPGPLSKSKTIFIASYESVCIADKNQHNKKYEIAHQNNYPVPIEKDPHKKQDIRMTNEVESEKTNIFFHLILTKQNCESKRVKQNSRCIPY